MNGTHRKRVAIAIPYAYLDSMPGVKSLCNILAEPGNLIDIYTIKKENYTTPTFASEFIRVIIYGEVFRGIKSGASGVLFFLKYFIFYAKSIIASLNRYDMHVGIGLRGGVIAVIAARILRRHSVYYSMELYCTEKSTSKKNWVNSLVEGMVFKLANVILIQDLSRAEIIKKHYALGDNKIAILPNSINTFAKRNKTTYLYDEHEIPYNLNILLYIGALSDTCRVLELVKGFQRVPDNWVLVVHSKWDGYDKAIEGYINKLKAAANNRVIIRTKAVALDQLTELIDSADVGVALYDSKSMNVHEVGLSSGKIGHYLASGLPIVVSSQESLSIFTENCRAGITINGGDELAAALDTIKSDYEGYVQRSVACYNKYYSIENYKYSVLKATKCSD